jgi:hypothetical protein
MSHRAAADPAPSSTATPHYATSTHAAESHNVVPKYLDFMACTSLPDYAEHDINIITNIARIMVQDVH